MNACRANPLCLFLAVLAVFLVGAWGCAAPAEDSSGDGMSPFFKALRPERQGSPRRSDGTDSTPKPAEERPELTKEKGQ